MERGQGHIVDQLIEYWRGNPPANGAERYRCKVLAERLTRHLPAAEARAIQAAPERHREAIGRALAGLKGGEVE
jgi:hypothetical protein